MGVLDVLILWGSDDGREWVVLASKNSMEEIIEEQKEQPYSHLMITGGVVRKWDKDSEIIDWLKEQMYDDLWNNPDFGIWEQIWQEHVRPDDYEGSLRQWYEENKRTNQ